MSANNDSCNYVVQDDGLDGTEALEPAEGTDTEPSDADVTAPCDMDADVAALRDIAWSVKRAEVAQARLSANTWYDPNATPHADTRNSEKTILTIICPGNNFNQQALFNNVMELSLIHI